MEHIIGRLISYTSIVVSIFEPITPLSSKRHKVREFINRSSWERILGALEGSD